MKAVWLEQGAQGNQDPGWGHQGGADMDGLVGSCPRFGFALSEGF